MAIFCVLRTSIFLYVFFIISPMKMSSIPESEALLQLKKSFMNAEALESWEPGSEPCAKGMKWVGLACHNGKVAGLRLTQLGLAGKIDVDAMVQLSDLRSLSFENNSFSGPIPELNRMGALKNIYLSGNQFSGEIPPDFFTKVGSLKKIWLSRNEFAGEIPLSLSQLPHLISLHLDNNQFSGAIPPFEQPTLRSLDASNNRLKGDIPISLSQLPNLISLHLQNNQISGAIPPFEQPSLKLLNFSNNSLTGEIPPSLSRFNASSFEGNDELCGEKLGKTCNQTAEPPAVPPAVPNNNKGPLSTDSTSSNDNNSDAIISVGFMITSVIILGLMIVGISILRRRQEKFEVIEKDGTLDESVGLSVSSPCKKDIDLARKGMGSSRKGSSRGSKGIGDLVLITDDKDAFGLGDLMKAAAEVLGNGTLGSSYKAMMSNGFTVVVKRTRDMNKIEKDAFDAEIRRFGRLGHRNVLTPLAYHYRKDEKLLIYEYIPKGSLLYLLHGDRGPSHAELNWPTRLKIIQGIAWGLGYLHTELASLDLPHGDLKSSNVLLSPDHEPLLVDYGFSALINSNQVAQALFAYKSPEALQHHHVTPKCDVYCLGIIILEILTGKFPSQYLSNGKGGTDVVQWVNSAILEGRESELFDPEIASNENAHGEMVTLLRIGAACTESNPEQRIDIREAVRRIEELQLEGGQEDRTYHLLPSLRDGYADAPASRLSSSVRERGEVSGRRPGVLGAQCSNNSFAFDIS